MRAGARPLAPLPLLAALLLLAAGASPVAAQGPLERVDALAREGRTDQARQELAAWWDGGRAGASRPDLQRGIWLRAILTVDPSQARLDFQRLVVEHPGGPFTDQALVRLARSAEASGDLVEAALRFRSVVEDYPGSPSRLEATGWLSAHADAVRQAEDAARQVEDAARRAEDVAGQVEDAAPRAEEGPHRAEAAPAREDGAAVPVPLAPSSAAPEAESYTVQLGAFSTEARARALMGRVESAGFDVRLARVEGSDLVRVRVGRYRDAEAALAVYDRIRARGFEATVSRDASREVPLS